MTVPIPRPKKAIPYLKLLTSASALCLLPSLLFAQPVVPNWEAFNDYRPNPGVTSPNASTYELRLDGSGGPMLNIQTGEELPVSVLVTTEGSQVPDDFGDDAEPKIGSPAYRLFNGFVDIGNPGLPGLRASANVKLILNFSGLDASKRYKFRGTVTRGGSYNDRWSVFSITGTDHYVAAHEDGSKNKNIITSIIFPRATLEPNQVALNAGENKDGSLVGWDNIEPSPDGTFAIEQQQYTGPTPFGVAANAGYSYGLNAIYLAEVEATGLLRITENPESRRVPAGKTATFSVTASSPNPIQYQWQRSPGEGEAFTDIPGATSASYTTPKLSTADDGTIYRAQIISGPDKGTSGEATLNVDGTLPTISAVRGGINRDAVYVTFSEAMDLDSLADAAQYALDNGLVISSVDVLSPTFVKLWTSGQELAHRYNVTVNNVTDIAGNPIASNSKKSFVSASIQQGFAGLEIWNDLLGGGVTDLVNSPRYPATPTVDQAVASFDSLLVYPDASVNTYGARFRAWLTPTESADYYFFLRADDAGELRVGVDDDFAALESPDVTPVASGSNGNAFVEPGSGNTTTADPLFLEAGHRYAIQAIWKESNGNDFCQIAWRKADDGTAASDLQPISSEFLSYYAPGTETAAPTVSPIVLDKGSISLEWTGSTLQVSTDLINWVDVPGATSPYHASAQGKQFFRSKN